MAGGHLFRENTSQKEKGKEKESERKGNKEFGK